MSHDFYADVVRRSRIAMDAAILVVCGGQYDRKTFLDAGYKNVTISNLEPHERVESNYEPYSWVQQDAENLQFPDDAFDWVVVNAGLHHCGSPHKALCEMFRVCRRGILVLEARDSFLMQLAVKLKLTVDYELEPIALSGASAATAFGGLRSTFIPNYVYRWTERELEKTIASSYPQYQHGFRFFYGLRLPTQRLSMSRSVLIRWFVRGLAMVSGALTTCLPKQTNEFAAMITKRAQIQPWLLATENGLEINRPYFDDLFATEKYRK